MERSKAIRYIEGFGSEPCGIMWDIYHVMKRGKTYISVNTSRSFDGTNIDTEYLISNKYEEGHSTEVHDYDLFILYKLDIDIRTDLDKDEELWEPNFDPYIMICLYLIHAKRSIYDRFDSSDEIIEVLEKHKEWAHEKAIEYIQYGSSFNKRSFYGEFKDRLLY